MRKLNSVYVLSWDGWTWAVAWAQIGVTRIRCIPMTEIALEQLHEINETSVFHGSLLQTTEVELMEESNIRVISLHLSTASAFDLGYLSALVQAMQSGDVDWICLLSTMCSAKQLKELRSAIDLNFTWQALRHAAMGGLTSARVTIGLGSSKGTAGLQIRSQPKRPLGRFLDPVARCARWRRPVLNARDCWFPLSDNATPYPWPWTTGPKWVETHSVLMKGTIQRLLTSKEQCQLWDIRSDWIDLIPFVCKWMRGSTPPIRLCVEAIVMTRKTIWNHFSRDEDSQLKGQGGDLNKIKEIKIGMDWGRTRPLGVDNGMERNFETIEQVLYFGWYWSPEDALDISVATKGDDAEVDLALWAVGGDAKHYETARGVIRNFLWKIWVRSICREARRWWSSQKTTPQESRRNQVVIIDCLHRCIYSSWWNWDSGSCLFFWRWPPIWRNEARDGSIGFHYKFPKPRLKFPQMPIAEQWIIDKDKEKLEKLLRRRYIVPGHCKTTVPRFPVPKGSDDIRVVWDLSKNGLNETMYTPTFFLASMATYLRRIEPGFYGGDFDVGEQFHNYPLHEAEQTYCGVEIPADMVKALNEEGLEVQPLMRWGRLVFGWQSSPYMALRMFARALEVAKGTPTEPGSYFAWARVCLNLPGSAEYDPSRPRVMKVTADGSLACDIVTFYDDGRVFGPTEELAHGALRQITSRIQYLGNQDAARKRRGVSQRPGAWAGGVAYTDGQFLRVFISQVKWDKAKAFLEWVWERVQKKEKIERKRFQSGKGFLVYVTLCYEFMQPYMKGFHLSEDAWRKNRDQQGWKIKLESEIVGDIDDGFDSNSPETQDTLAPPMIDPVPRLEEDVRILRIFFGPPTPVQVIARPVMGSKLVVYGGGDASGEGYGGQLQPLGASAIIRRGFWCPDDAGESSNWRELRNLVDTLRNEAHSGSLAGKEVWLATDNSTAANAFHRGTSSSQVLHEMITDLRMLTIEGNFLLHLYHIAGTRMIQSGIDGLSRGELHVSSLEESIRTVVPLHLSPMERSPALRGWLEAWLDDAFKIACPEDWFYQAQQIGETNSDLQPITWVWDLPPGAAMHVVEELGTARLRRHNILRGVVLIPNLLANEWFRRFSRIVDMYFFVTPGSIPEWPISMHESLTVGLYLPLFRHQPWDWKRVPFMVPLGGTLSAMHKATDPEARSVLRKFWRAGTGITALPKRLVSDVLQNPSWRRFLSVSPHR